MDFFRELNLEKKLNILTENFIKASLSYPSRKELSSIFLENQMDIDVLKIERTSFFQVSQFLLDKVYTTKKKLITRIENIYTGDYEDSEFLINLTTSSKVASIINFSYDNRLHNKSNIIKLQPTDSAIMPSNVGTDKLKLYKPFGDVEDLEKAIITNQDLKRLIDLNYHNEYFMNLRSELRSKTNIIVGVDVNNYDFFQMLNFILGDISSSAFKFYFITEAEIKNEFIKKIIKKYNIKVVPTSTYDFSEEVLGISLKREASKFTIESPILEEEEETFDIEASEVISEEVIPPLENLQYPLFESIEVSEAVVVTEETPAFIDENIQVQEEVVLDIPETTQENLNFQPVEEVTEEIIEEVIEEPYIPQTITLSNNEAEVETAFDLKFTSYGLDTLPILSSNLPINISLEDISIIGNADIKIGKYIFTGCYIKVVGDIQKNIKLLEIKSKEMIIRIGINYFASGKFSLAGDLLFYKIYSNVSLNRAINMLEMLESLFSNLELEFDLPKLSGKILLNRPLEVVKTKALLNLFTNLKSSNYNLKLSKLEGIDNIYSKLNLELLDEEVEYKTWCNYKISCEFINPEDNLIINKLYQINDRLAVEAIITIKKPVAESDLLEGEFVGHKKVCTMKLKKVKGW